MTQVTADKNRSYSGLITRERQKKTGEFFTPDVLIDKMIDRAGETILEMGKTMFEPAAGDGNILARYITRRVQYNVERGVQAAVAAADAIRNVYACEYMKDNRDAIVRRLLDLAVEYGCITTGKRPNCALRAAVRDHVVYCNTVDPWDTSEGRSYPAWLIEAIPSDRWVYMRKKSKNYKENKSLHYKKCAEADAELTKNAAKASGQQTLDDLFGI